MRELGMLLDKAHLSREDHSLLVKKFDEFLAMIVAMRQAQKKAYRLKYTIDTEQRAEALLQEREAEKMVDKALYDIIEELD